MVCGWVQIFECGQRLTKKLFPVNGGPFVVFTDKHSRSSVWSSTNLRLRLTVQIQKLTYKVKSLKYNWPKWKSDKRIEKQIFFLCYQKTCLSAVNSLLVINCRQLRLWYIRIYGPQLSAPKSYSKFQMILVKIFSLKRKKIKSFQLLKKKSLVVIYRKKPYVPVIVETRNHVFK